MCSFPYTAAVKTVQALWPKLFFSSKKIFIPFVQSDRQQRFCAAFLQFLRYFKSAVQLHLPCPVAVFESGGWRMITGASVPPSVTIITTTTTTIVTRWRFRGKDVSWDGLSHLWRTGTWDRNDPNPSKRTAAGWTGNHTHPVLGLCPGGKVSHWVEMWKPQKVSQRKLSDWDLDSAWTVGFRCELVNWLPVLVWTGKYLPRVIWSRVPLLGVHGVLGVLWIRRVLSAITSPPRWRRSAQCGCFAAVEPSSQSPSNHSQRNVTALQLPVCNLEETISWILEFKTHRIPHIWNKTHHLA